jgi:D,D-heptose 1,7-bisphosphate phosphatase
MRAIILAAGRGERLKPMTDKLPKPMVLIDGRPSLEYLILLCKKYGIKDIAINTSYLPEKIREYFEDGKKWDVRLKFSFESELLGTAGALNNFRDFFDEPFFVIYGDAITNIDLTKMMSFHLKKKGIATLALRKKPKDYKTQSLILEDNGLITKFIEKPSEEQVNQFSGEYKLINSGIYILNPKILKEIPQGFSDFAYDIFPKIIEKKEKIYGFMMDDYYFREIGNINKYNIAREEIESGKIDLGLFNKAVFLDRDGVINKNIYEVDGRLMAPATIEQVELLPNVKEGISELKKMGFKVIVISNQPGVAFGYIDLKKLKQIDDFLKKELELDGIYYCPHHEKISGPCECRKPKPALINKAAKDFDLDLKKSFMVGDSLSDIQTGKNAGVKSNFLIGIVREDILNIQHQKDIFPDFTCKDLVEVAKKIKEIR